MQKNEKNVLSYIPVQMAEKPNEPEEGEIIDDYELISSDEELCMRQRIRELEEENAEIEQIAVISRSYDIDRAARIPTDVSSISSTEFKTPKKRKRHKNKDHKKKTCHHHHSTGHHRHHGTSSHIEKKTNRSRKTRCKRREKLLRKKNKKAFLRDMRENIVLGSSESLNSTLSSLSLSESDGSPRHIFTEDGRDGSNYYHRPEIRHTLRLAIARSRKNSTRQSGQNVDLKERLLRRDLDFTGNLFSNHTNGSGFHNYIDDEEEDVVICEPENEIQCVPDDSADSLEEKELRLIALKSAVLKKHMDRKKRNAEAAYSPTDFSDLISSCVVNSEDKLADLEVVDLDEDDSQNGCVTASPIASPQLMMLDFQEDSSLMVDCKPVDMDIANSDTEDESVVLTNWSSEIHNTIPYPPYPPNDLVNQYPYGLYIPDFNTNSLNPPPPGVDDYDEIKQIPAINPSKKHNEEIQDMDVENDAFEPIEPCSSTCNANKGESLFEEELKTNCESSSLHSKTMNDDHQDEEEEEQALRALLLSKFNSPKNQKKTVDPLPPASKVETENLLESQFNPDTGNITVKPIEAILKKAVKRLQVGGICKEDKRQESSSNVEQAVSNDYLKDNGLNKPHVLWDQDHQQEFVYDIPLPHKKESDLKPLNCLKKKVQELKSSKDIITSYEVCQQLITPPAINFDIVEERLPLLSSKEVGNKRLPSPPTVTYSKRPGSTVANLDEDTKRRLQKLKDEILSATLNNQIDPLIDLQKQQNETGHNVHEDDFEANRRSGLFCEEDGHNTTTQEDCNLNKPNANIKITATAVIAKTIKSPLNDARNGIDVSLDKTTLKENNPNKQNKSKSKINTNIVSVKNSQETKMLVRTVNNTVVAIKPQEIKAVPNKIVKKIAPTAASISSQGVTSKAFSTYSVLRTTKIVKPNKVINKNVDLKRKVVLIKQDPPAASPPKKKIVKTETPEILITAKTIKPIENSRLITSMDQVRHMYAPVQLVISLQNSSNESSEDEWMNNCDTKYKPLYDYNDISSPLSLHLESPSLTPTRSNSPVDSLGEKTTNLFKLNRTPITFCEDMSAPTLTIDDSMQKSVEPVVKTPVAVRHLPSAAQDEYRKLVNRMKLLESQRLKKENLNVSKKSSTSKENNENSSIPNLKSTLVKKVLIRNTNNKSQSTCLVTAEKAKVVAISDIAAKPHKANVLRTYESLYVKIGAGIVNNLDKSLSLVEEAKNAKINKLRLEARLKKLKAEMELLQTCHKEEEKRISRIYPSICSTNDVITSMKQKRSKVLKAALDLGKSLNGNDYRLNNDLKQNIVNKSKKLACEIRKVNSLKAEDIERLLFEEHKPKDTEKRLHKESSIEINDSSKSCKIIKEVTQGTTQVVLKTQDSERVFEQSSLLKNNVNTTDNVDGDVPKLEDEKWLIHNDNVDNSEEHEEENAEQSTPPNNCPNNIETTLGGKTKFQESPPAYDHSRDAEGIKCREFLNKKEGESLQLDQHQKDDRETAEVDSKGLLSYTSPLDHLRNINGTVDPNGVVCPYDLMGNCEDTSCKYVHISKRKIDFNNKMTD